MRDRSAESNPEVYIQALISARQRTYLLKEARQRGVTFSDYLRRIIDEAIRKDSKLKAKT